MSGERFEMSQTHAAVAPVKEFDNFEHGFPAGFGPGGWGHLAYAIGIAFAGFQIAIAAWNVLPSQVVRGVHVGFLILMTFGLVANITAKINAGRALGWFIGGIGFLCGLYQWIFYADLILRDGDPTTLDLVVGTLLAVLIFEGTRRLMGLALPLMCGACIVYWCFGQYLPAPFNHRGYAFDQIITHLSYGTEGFYGVPIYVSATYIFLFIMFGSFLERAGMIQLFTDVSLGLFGRTRGGPAKVAVVASGLMGTISGSGVANVVTVGQFTIPLMIKFGYRRAFAAGVEATASMGGQIMPPVMGAVAFIMAETLGVDYSVNRQGRRDSGRSLFRLRILDGASRSRQERVGRDGAVRDSQRLEGAGRSLVSRAAAGRAGLHAVRGFHAALCRHHRLVTHGDADPWRQHRARPVQ
jgi:TRAP-type uncharacterized transport system fused permease subunit